MESMNDEIRLIKDIQAGKEAFEQLVRRYQHYIFRIIRIYTQNDNDAEDLSQETWIKVYRSIRKLKEPYHLESWLRTIAVNTTKNWLKSRRYKEAQATDEMQSQQLWGAAVTQYQQQGLMEEIRDAIDSLSKKNRQVVLDFYILGYSTTEISQRLNIPQSTVTGRLQKARKQLRKEFETMVAQSGIQGKFAPDSLIRNVMDRVASLPTPTPTGNIVQRIGRMFPKEAIQIIGFVLIMFTVIALISINVGYLRFDFNRSQKGNAMITAPAQAPKQEAIAFTSTRDGNCEIYIMGSDGKNQIKLTDNPGNDWHPAWSPDGQWIAFHSNHSGNFEIYVMNADGQNQQNLTNRPTDELLPSWSPDGQRIAFHSNRDKNNEIYIMDADGQNQHNLTNNPSHDFNPSWSPDGQKIVFERMEAKQLEIYVMGSDGKNQIKLTDNPANDCFQVWSPDSRKIAFTSNRDGINEIYVMDADGQNQQNLANNPSSDLYPDWFDPAFARSVPSPAGKLKAIWGWLKLNSK